MLKEKNEEIDRICFASLILDYEFPGDDFIGSYASGRVLIDGYFKADICGENREDLIKKFRSGNY